MIKEANMSKLQLVNYKQLRATAKKDPQQALRDLQKITEKNDGGWAIDQFENAVNSFAYLAKGIALNISDDSGLGEDADYSQAATDGVFIDGLDDDRKDFDTLFAYIEKHPNDDYTVDGKDGLRPVTTKDADKAIREMVTFLDD